MNVCFQCDGLDYVASMEDQQDGYYMVNVIFVGTQDPNVGIEIQRYAEELMQQRLAQKPKGKRK
jgi:hypothetical protein